MAKEKKFITCDGSTAVANVAYLFSENACIYPITPSSPMAENIDEWAAHGKKNLWGETVSVTELESEAGCLPEQCTAPSRPVSSPRPTQLHRVFSL